MVKLGDVAEQISSRVDNPSESGLDRFVGLEHFDSGNLKIRRWGSTEDLISAMKLFKAGDTLFARRNAYLRRASMVDFDGVCSGDAIVLREIESRMINGFLPLILNTDAFWEYALSNAAGSMSKRVNVKSLLKYEFPLPPIEEQKRIAEILWAADEAGEQYLKTQVRLSSLKRRLFRESLSRCSAEPIACSKLFKDSPRNGYSPKTNASGKGSPTLSIGAVRDGRVNPEGNIKYAEISSTDLEKFRLVPGDILVVRGNGNKKLCGKAGLVSNVPDNCFYPDLLIRLTFDESKILPAFAVEQWNEPVTHNRLLSFAKSTNGIWKVNGKDLRQHSLEVPPLEIQRRIIQQLAEVSKREEAIARQTEATQNLKAHLANSMIGGDAHV